MFGHAATHSLRNLINSRFIIPKAVMLFRDIQSRIVFPYAITYIFNGNSLIGQYRT